MGRRSVRHAAVRSARPYVYGGQEAECECGMVLEFRAHLSAEGRVLLARMRCPGCGRGVRLALHVKVKGA